MRIELFGYATSPYVRKVGAYLYYKGLAFDFVPVSPMAPQETIGFSGGTRVPVLRIGDEWRRESSALGHWLEERFPDRPLLGRSADERARIMAVDDWISDTVIPGLVFRPALEAPLDLAFRHRAWRLAALVSSGTPLPEEVRNAWPVIVKSAPFIKEIVAGLDLTESMGALVARIFRECAAYLSDSPYLGGLGAPSLADLSLYALLAFPYQTGTADDFPLADHPTIGPWLRRMSDHLPDNPHLVPDSMIIEPLPWRA